jgi:hypothetical protein
MNAKERVRDLNCLLMVLEEIEKMGLVSEWHFSNQINDPKLKTKITSAAFDTGLLAARKLDHFFNGRAGDPTDIKADRFGPFPGMGRPLDDSDRTRLHKSLAHLTMPGEEMRFDDVNLDKITLPVWKRSEDFCKFILSSYLKPDAPADNAVVPDVRRVLRYVSSYLSRIEGKLPPSWKEERKGDMS